MSLGIFVAYPNLKCISHIEWHGSLLFYAWGAIQNKLTKFTALDGSDESQTSSLSHDLFVCSQLVARNYYLEDLVKSREINWKWKHLH